MIVVVVVDVDALTDILFTSVSEVPSVNVLIVSSPLVCLETTGIVFFFSESFSDSKGGEQCGIPTPFPCNELAFSFSISNAITKSCREDVPCIMPPYDTALDTARVPNDAMYDDDDDDDDDEDDDADATGTVGPME